MSLSSILVTVFLWNWLLMERILFLDKPEKVGKIVK